MKIQLKLDDLSITIRPQIPQKRPTGQAREPSEGEDLPAAMNASGETLPHVESASQLKSSSRLEHVSQLQHPLISSKHSGSGRDVKLPFLSKTALKANLYITGSRDGNPSGKRHASNSYARRRYETSLSKSPYDAPAGKPQAYATLGGRVRGSRPGRGAQPRDSRNEALHINISTESLQRPAGHQQDANQIRANQTGTELAGPVIDSADPEERHLKTFDGLGPDRMAASDASGSVAALSAAHSQEELP